MNKKLRFGLIAAIPIALCIAAVSIRVTVPKSDTVKLEGDVEVEVRPYYLQATGEVKSLPVGVGQRVSRGDVLAVLDDSQARLEIVQLQSALAKAQAALRDLNQTENEELRQAQVRIAQNNVTIAREGLAAARQVLAQLQEQYTEAQALFDAGLAAQTELDAAANGVTAQQSAVAIAAAQLDSAEEQLTIARTDTQADLSEKIAMAQADIDSIEAQVAYAELQLEHYTVQALEDGLVISLAFDEGSLAFSGTQLCELSRENLKKFVFYLPQEYLDFVDYGTVLTVTGKASSDQETVNQYTATVQYIDLNAEYTPREMESSANKNRLSFKVEALLEPDCDLRVAQKASVTFGS